MSESEGNDNSEPRNKSNTEEINCISGIDDSLNMGDSGENDFKHPLDNTKSSSSSKLDSAIGSCKSGFESSKLSDSYNCDTTTDNPRHCESSNSTVSSHHNNTSEATKENSGNTKTDNCNAPENDGEENIKTESKDNPKVSDNSDTANCNQSSYVVPTENSRDAHSLVSDTTFEPHGKNENTKQQSETHDKQYERCCSNCCRSRCCSSCNRCSWYMCCQPRYNETNSCSRSNEGSKSKLKRKIDDEETHKEKIDGCINEIGSGNTRSSEVDTAQQPESKRPKISESNESQRMDAYYGSSQDVNRHQSTASRDKTCRVCRGYHKENYNRQTDAWGKLDAIRTCNKNQETDNIPYGANSEGKISRSTQTNFESRENNPIDPPEKRTQIYARGYRGQRFFTSTEDTSRSDARGYRGQRSLSTSTEDTSRSDARGYRGQRSLSTSTEDTSRSDARGYRGQRFFTSTDDTSRSTLSYVSLSDTSKPLAPRGLKRHLSPSPHISRKRKAPKKGEQCYNNAYLNYFVRLFHQEQFRGVPASLVAKYAGARWRNHMSEGDKRPYYKMMKFAKPRNGKK